MGPEPSIEFCLWTERISLIPREHRMTQRHIAYRSASLRRRGLALLASTAMLVSGGISLAVAPGANAVPLACDSPATQKITLAPDAALQLDLDPATCGSAAVVSAPGYFGVGTVWLHVVASGIQHLSAGESVANASYDLVRFVAPSTVQAAAVQFTVGSVSFEITVATTPGAPSGLSATGGASKIDLAWSAPVSDGGSGVTGYRIEVSDTDASSGFTTLVAAQPGLTYADSSLADSATRYYRVYAINLIGTSATYAEATATTNAAPGSNTVPSAPASATAVGGVRQATVTWTPPLDDGGLPVTYTVVRSITGDFVNDPTYTAPGEAGPSNTLTSLADGQQVWFRVFAVNSEGASLGFAEATATAVIPTDVPYTIGCDVGQTVEYTIDPGERLVLTMSPVCHGVRPLAAGIAWHAQAFYTELGGYPYDLNGVQGVSTAGDMTPFEYTAVDDGYGYAMSDQFFVTPEQDAASLNGTTVRIEITGTQLPTQANDDIENALILPVGSVTVNGDNTIATRQQGEYNGTGDGGTHTVWFTWTAPEEFVGPATIDTCGSGFDTTLAVFEAGTFAIPIADNDDGGCGTQSSVTFPVTPGASYSVQANGFDDSEYGPFVLNYSVAGGTATPVVPTPTPGGGGSSTPAADSGSGSAESAVVKPVKVPVVSTAVPAAATALIRQTARIKAPSSRQFVVGTQVVLAKKAVKTNAGVTVRWSRTKASAGVCTVATVGGRAVATMLKPGTCTVVGTAAAPSSAYSAFQTTRTYRVR